MSPVCSQPSGSSASRVFSGSPRYPVITISPRTSSSPSSASFSSTPFSGGPQVPVLIAAGGLIVAHEDVSDIPHSSQIGSPSAAK